MNIASKIIDRDPEQQHREDIERVRKLRPMDDDFLRELLRNNLPLTQAILQIIMQKDDLILIKAQPQYDLKRSSGARGLCLDVWAKDSSDRIYNLEIQRRDEGAEPHRARYHSAALDVENLGKGQDFEMLPDTYVIFITENDIFGEGVPFYPVERVNTVTGKSFNDGEHILYVNGAYNGDSEIGRLMHDFRCSDPDEMYNEMLAEKTRYLKESTKGMRKMCRILEEMRNEVAREVAREIARETKIECANQTALNILNSGMGIEYAAKITGLTPEEVQELAEENDLVTV